MVERNSGPNMFKHILLPTDGSDRSAGAIAAGIEFARATNAQVTGLFVVKPVYISEIDERPKPSAEAALAQVAEQASRSGVACECITVMGETPQDGIVRVATDRACDLIVMGTRGRSRVGKFILGSTAASILADCEIPVLLFR